MKLEFHPEAEMELIAAAAHYELQVPGLGERFEAELRRATEILLEHPEIGAPTDPDLHIRCVAHRGRRAPKPSPRLLANES